MTQQQYLQWMVFVCGDPLSRSAADADLIRWARDKGINPTGGWNLGSGLTKEVMAQTLVQLLKLPPAKGDSDAVRTLESAGIFIGTSSGGYVTVSTFKRVVNDGLASRAALGRCEDGKKDDKGHGHGGGGHDGDDDDDDDDDGKPPTKTKPGHGHGDKNHDHTGPPGKDKGKDKKDDKTRH